MAIPYVLVKRGNPRDRLIPKRWYAAASSYREMTYNEMCEEVSYASSATMGDVSLAIDGCLASIVRHLSAGEIVQLGNFGRFHMSIENVHQVLNEEGNWVTAAPTEREDFKAAKNIAGCKIVFTPGPALRNMMKAAKYTMMDGGTPVEP